MYFIVRIKKKRRFRLLMGEELFGVSPIGQQINSPGVFKNELPKDNSCPHNFVPDTGIKKKNPSYIFFKPSENHSK